MQSLAIRCVIYIDQSMPLNYLIPVPLSKGRYIYTCTSVAKSAVHNSITLAYKKTPVLYLLHRPNQTFIDFNDFVILKIAI